MAGTVRDISFNHIDIMHIQLYLKQNRGSRPPALHSSLPPDLRWFSDTTGSNADVVLQAIDEMLHDIWHSLSGLTSHE